MSFVTGLSLLSGDVKAAGLSPQQQEYLRQWLLKNQNASQLRVVWQPAAAAAPTENVIRHAPPRLQRRPKVAHSRAVLKAGYDSSPPVASPAPPPRVYVISAPASMSGPSKPAQSPAPPPHSMPSYNPSPKPQSMAHHRSAQTSSSQTMMYAMPAAASKPQSPHAMSAAMPMPQPSMTVQSPYSVSEAQPDASYRVIYIQSPQPAAPAPAKPRSPPARPAVPPPHPPHPPPPPPSQSHPSHQSNGATAPDPAAAPAAASSGPQTLFIVVPSGSSSEAMMTVKSSTRGAQLMTSYSHSQPTLPPCPPAPGKHFNLATHGVSDSCQGCLKQLSRLVN